MSSDGKLIYQLNPDFKYRPNKLDSSGYPGPGLVKWPYLLAGCLPSL